MRAYKAGCKDCEWYTADSSSFWIANSVASTQAVDYEIRLWRIDFHKNILSNGCNNAKQTDRQEKMLIFLKYSRFLCVRERMIILNLCFEYWRAKNKFEMVNTIVHSQKKKKLERQLQQEYWISILKFLTIWKWPLTKNRVYTGVLFFIFLHC